MNIQANPQFEAWAKGNSGFQGGNPDGAVWFCGLEYGDGISEAEMCFSSCDDVPCVEGDERAQFIAFQYNQKLAKLYSALLGYPVSSFREVYGDTLAFSKDSDTFKLNLYPIPFKNTDESHWEKWLFDRTGFPTKSLYLSWCQLNRFPVFAERVKRHKPKLIIGTGSGWRKEFVMAFSGLANVFQPLKAESICTKPLYWTKINDGQTLLAVVPFLGRGGLQSDQELEAFGQFISGLCSDHFEKEWCRYLTNHKSSTVTRPGVV